jgi:hypothetical protein
MKSELINYKKGKTEIKFPVLAKSTDSDLVVLFTGQSTGIVVFSDRVYDIGAEDSDWIYVSDSSAWEILPPGAKVVLENT